MSFIPVPNVPVSTGYIAVDGTVDFVSPALQIDTGVAVDSGNFVPEITGGAKRIGGYERYDGHSAPSDALYYVAAVDTTSLLAVGNVITGVTSAKTATVIYIISSTTLVCTRNSGVFTVGETLNVGGAAKAVLSLMSQSGAATQTDDVTYTALAADEYRTSISAVPGSGSIRGVWNYQGTIVAFRDNAGGTAGTMWRATSGGWVQVTAGVPALVPGGRYEFINFNFSGASTGMKMYGCDGMNKAFSWDGTTYVEITTTAVPETPQHIAGHKNRLFLTVNGSVYISAPGDPMGTWVAASGAAEIGTGDKITAMTVLPGTNSSGALAIYGRSKTSILYGAGTDTWNLNNVAADAGAIEYTAQFAGVALALDDRGVTSLAAVQEYGNFAASTLSKPVQPFLEARVGLAIASSVLRSQDQYRVYFTDGAGLAFRVSRNGEPAKVMPFFYPNPVTCICSGETTSGREVVYFGSTNGMVYQAEVGTSFDGAAIDAWLRLAFNSTGAPTTQKKWRRAICEVTVSKYAAISMNYSMDYGDGTFPIVAIQSTEQDGGGGFWDQFTWDEFVWDSPLISLPKYQLSGTSQNISLLFMSNDALSTPYVIQSVIIHYTPRRMKR